MNLATIRFGDISGFKPVVSVYAIVPGVYISGCKPVLSVYTIVPGVYISRFKLVVSVYEIVPNVLLNIYLNVSFFTHEILLLI